jgi:hypothetical protein
MDLNDVLITDELSTRKSRPVDVFAEHRALNTIARRMHHGRAAVLQEICEFAMTLCQADFSGISILQQSEETGFVWEAVAGNLTSLRGGTAPLHSPCGVCLHFRSTQLYSRPERYFEWMHGAAIPIAEALVVPLFREKKQSYGTIWVLHSRDGVHFDQETRA